MKIVPSTSSQATISALREIFSSQGLPQVLVSDNGTAFTSTEFGDFMKRNGIHHVRTSPYHPAGNGLAECSVQTFKEAMRKTSGDIETRFARFLFQYRITPHTTTGTLSAELLQGRRLRTHLDLLQPQLKAKVQKKQENQKKTHDCTARMQKFEPSDLVWIRNFTPGSTLLLQGING